MTEVSKTIVSSDQTRVITVYSTSGNTMVEIPSKAKLWKELQKELREFRVNFENMKAVIGDNRHTLESPDAALPDTSFTLFLMPVKTKSGADLDRKTLFEKIKELIAKNPAMKQNFIVDGKNMTQLSTPKLNELWNQFGGGTASPITTTGPAKPATAKAGSAAAKKAVSSVVNSLTDKKKLEEELEKAKAAYKKAVADDVDEETQDMLLEKITKLKQQIKDSSSASVLKREEPVETPQERAAREERERKDAKLKELSAEAYKMSGEFRDVK